MPEPVQEVLSCKLSSFTALDHLVQQQWELIDDNQQLCVRLKRLPDDAFPLNAPRVGKLFAQFQLELPDFELFDVLCCRREKRAEEAFDIAMELRGFDSEIYHEILWSIVILAVKPDHIEAGSWLKIQFQHQAGLANAARCCQEHAMALQVNPNRFKYFLAVEEVGWGNCRSDCDIHIYYATYLFCYIS